MSAELGARIEALDDADLVDVGGVGGTLAGNALSLAAARATLDDVLTAEAFDAMIALCDRFVAGVRGVLADRDVPWSIVQLGARAELAFTPDPPRTGGDERGPARRARGRPAPLPAQSRRDDHAVSQHGAHVARDDDRRRRSPHRGVRRGRGGARLSAVCGCP